MLLPSDINPRSFLLPSAVSYSELATLSHCEKKWSLIYDTEERPEKDSSDAMDLGTELHDLLNNWWMGHDYKCSDLETARWLMDRYDEVYRSTDNLEMERVDVPFAVKAFGTWIFGWFDGLVRNLDTGELWIAEFKSMNNWSRLHLLPKDKQISLYIYAARKMGLKVKGVMFDALLTTHWKTEDGEVYKSGPKKGMPKDFHPAADSFQRIWVERTDEDMEDFIEEVQSTLSRKSDLFWRVETPIRNVGRACSWCPAMAPCFGLDLTLLPEDDTLVS